MRQVQRTNKISVGSLKVGDTFLLRRSGRGYTIHDKADSRKHDPGFTVMINYTIAMCDGKMHVFTDDQMVIPI